ncbi:MAG: hypothetical protein PVJ53_01970 [Desulfobacterales bacterium]
MQSWFRIGMLILMIIAAAPLEAQEWIYCPAAAEELERQCRQSEQTITVNEERMKKVGAQMRDHAIILARVNRKPGETVRHYRSRVKQQQGVATPTTNRWLPVLGRYYDPDRQIMYVALDRRDYWQYVWESLAPDEDFARRTFSARERISQQFKRTYFTNPGGWLPQWQQAMDSARLFQQQCCQTPSTTEIAPPAE